MIDCPARRNRVAGVVAGLYLVQTRQALLASPLGNRPLLPMEDVQEMFGSVFAALSGCTDLEQLNVPTDCDAARQITDLCKETP